MSYCTRQDLIDRLGVQGLLYVADDDGDAWASEREQQMSLDPAIANADSQIDAALGAQVEVPVAQANEWLRHRAIDLALEHVLGNKGGPIPSAVALAADRSRRWLDEVRRGVFRVPGLVYPLDGEPRASRPSGLPRVGNPDRKAAHWDEHGNP